MALPTTGPLSLDDIHVEAGGATGTLCTINDADILALIGKTASTEMGFDEWYGASAVILLTESDFQTIADPSISAFDADPTNQNPYGPNLSTPNWQFGPSRNGHQLNASYDNVAFTFNRFVQVTCDITVTDIFNLPGVDSSATGKTLYFEYQAVNRSGGSGGTSNITTTFYQSDLTTVAVSSVRTAGSTTNDTYSVTTFGGTITSSNNGEAQLRVIDAVGNNYNTGTSSGNSAQGMSHQMLWRTPLTPTNQNIRIE